jgi:hypothetical protein
MPRKPNLALAISVVAALTLGVGAAYVAVDARPASPVRSATAASSGAAQDTCAPKYRVRKTRLGLNRFGSEGFGRVPVVRNWDTHGELRSSWSEQTRDVPRRTAMVISFRYSPQQVIAGQWDAQINGFFKNAPQRRLVFWNFYHEPETPVKAHEFTPTQFRKAFRHIDRISARYCRPNLLPTLVLQGWTADPHSGASVNGLWDSWKDFYPGRRYVSVVAWDPYNSARAVPSSYVAPRFLYSKTVRASRSVHKAWGMAETGSALVPGDNGTKRARWLHRVAAYSRKHNAAFVTYFNSAGGGVDFRLLDSHSRNAWNDEIHR